MCTTFLLSILAVAVPVLSAPTRIPITKRAGSVNVGSYIVKFKDGSSKASLMDTLTKKFAEPGSQASMTHEYHDFFHGVAARITSPDTLSFVQTLPGVEYVEEDGVVSVSYESELDGLARTIESTKDGHVTALESSPTKRGATGNGQGVVIYGIDTGIYTGHNCFGGRARWGKTFAAGQSDTDGNGHGTHTAATAVCQKYGLATGSTIIAVKVLHDDGSGYVSDVIAGIHYAVEDSGRSGAPSIAILSLAGSRSEPLDAAVRAAIAKGLHFAIAAGNDSMDADFASPARVREANTVGAVYQNNTMAYFSNYGKPVDVFALGVNVTSAWIGSPSAENTLSGTSMATPHVAGILAITISNHGNTDPKTLSDALKANAKPAVTETPPYTTDLLAQLW